MSKFKASVIEEFDALKSSLLAEVDSFKKRHFISCGNDVLVENSERLIKQLQEDIKFLREQLKNKGEVIQSLLQQLAAIKYQTKFIGPCFLTIKKYSKTPPMKYSYWTHQLLSMRQKM